MVNDLRMPVLFKFELSDMISKLFPRGSSLRH